VDVVLAAAGAGVPVTWWAGGGPSVPLRARLSRRTRAVVAEASAGCMVFFGSPVSRGSLLAAQVAVERELPVVAFPLGFPAVALPALRAGAWVPVGGAGVWARAWRWVAGQSELF
jgi:TRAP-type C4-dicarboxylate transport system permease small subunit